MKSEGQPPENKKDLFPKRWWIILILFLFVAMKTYNSIFDFFIESFVTAQNKYVQNAQEKESLPLTESKFIEAITKAQNDVKYTENDMQRGKIKTQRDHEICRLISNSKVESWIGKVIEISANGDGKGVLSLEISPGIKVKTVNNAFSDVFLKSLIDPNSKLFDDVSSLKVGQNVVFSGVFLRWRNGTECIYESSLTLQGKLEEPEFIFKFSKIRSIETQ